MCRREVEEIVSADGRRTAECAGREVVCLATVITHCVSEPE